MNIFLNLTIHRLREGSHFSYFVFRIRYCLAFFIQGFSIPVSILSYLYVRLRSELLFLKVICNLELYKTKLGKDFLTIPILSGIPPEGFY